MYCEKLAFFNVSVFDNLWASLRKKCPYSEFFLSAFSRIRAEYEGIRSSIFSYSWTFSTWHELFVSVMLWAIYRNVCKHSELIHPFATKFYTLKCFAPGTVDMELNWTSKPVWSMSKNLQLWNCIKNCKPKKKLPLWAM